MISVLTVAGSDSGGGAGVQADLKTFLDHGAFGMSVITAVTAQSPRRVTRIDLLPVDGVRAQLEVVLADLPVHGVKVGMLGSEALVRAVAEALGAVRAPIVVDPVLVSSTGARLLDARAERALRDHLLPLATLVTPNRAEAHALGLPGDLPALVTGGDAGGDEVIDTLYAGGLTRVFRAPRAPGCPHGTGCTLSSAIAVRLARGEPLEVAVEGGIRYTQALIRAGGAQLAHGLVPGAPSAR